MIPTTLHIAAIVMLATGLASALYMTAQMVRRPPKMAVMRLVWPLCALFAGPLLIWFYHRFGTRHADANPFAATVAKGTLHCGAGCSLGDLIAENLAHYHPPILTWFGKGWLWHQDIFAAWTLDYVLALVIGIAFQYFAIVPMRDLSPGKGLVEAAKADTLSLSTWQIGMYGLMGLAHFWFFKQVLGAEIDAGTPLFWATMQLAMIAGFATAYLPNWFLIRTGIKEEM